jgi:hypothetical protein
MLLGLAFADNAFGPRGLTPEALGKLEIPEGKNQLQVPFDPKWMNIPVFRRAERTVDGWEISREKRMTYHMLYNPLKFLGNLVGFKQITRSYGFRYNGGKVFNENGMLDVSIC